MSSSYTSSPPKPRVLVIAGSDSSGGAGLEADQRVLTLHSIAAQTATTALTAQNSNGITAIHAVPPAFVVQCIETVWGDGDGDGESHSTSNSTVNSAVNSISAVKIGMLHSSPTISAVASSLAAKRALGCEFPIVLDPVMKATSGAVLLDPGAVQTLIRELLPLADIVTPNIPEAVLLVSAAGSDSDGLESDGKGEVIRPRSIDDVVLLARGVARVCRQGAWVLVKGGHFDGGQGQSQTQREVVDVLVHGEDVHLIKKPYVDSRNTHGTGCSLASAIAANLANGYEMRTAVERACKYVEGAIRGAKDWDIGLGNGGIDHWCEDGRY